MRGQPITSAWSRFCRDAATVVARLRLAPLAVVCLFGALLAACAGEPPPPAAAPTQAQDTAAPERGYVLGGGDKLRIVVFNEAELSREYEVDGAGKVSMLLVGPVQAAGLTPREFEAALATALKKFLRNPKVSVDVIGYRPFYVLGEVNKAGEYPYRNGMNVLSAVAAAGGHTYRANTRVVYIQRGNDQERSYETTTRVPIYPGDVIRVPERFF
jgi:protein involved in polysaccharide export with SLBB domain